MEAWPRVYGRHRLVVIGRWCVLLRSQPMRTHQRDGALVIRPVLACCAITLMIDQSSRRFAVVTRSGRSDSTPAWSCPRSESRCTYMPAITGELVLAGQRDRAGRRLDQADDDRMRGIAGADGRGVLPAHAHARSAARAARLGRAAHTAFGGRGVPHGWHPGSAPLPWPSPRFREAQHSLAHPVTGRMSNDVGGFASYYGPHRRSPYRALTLGSDPARFQTEPPACYRPPGSATGLCFDGGDSSGPGGAASSLAAGRPGEHSMIWGRHFSSFRTV